MHRNEGTAYLTKDLRSLRSREPVFVVDDRKRGREISHARRAIDDIICRLDPRSYVLYYILAYSTSTALTQPEGPLDQSNFLSHGMST